MGGPTGCQEAGRGRAAAGGLREGGRGGRRKAGGDRPVLLLYVILLQGTLLARADRAAAWGPAAVAARLIGSARNDWLIEKILGVHKNTPKT